MRLYLWYLGHDRTCLWDRVLVITPKVIQQSETFQPIRPQSQPTATTHLHLLAPCCSVLFGWTLPMQPSQNNCWGLVYVSFWPFSACHDDAFLIIWMTATGDSSLSQFIRRNNRSSVSFAPIPAGELTRWRQAAMGHSRIINLIAPELLKSIWCKLRVPNCMGDIPVSQVMLNFPLSV